MGTEAPADDRRKGWARVAHELPVPRFLQPDDVTCGPTCLRKVYHYYGLELEADAILGEIDRNEDGGTLAVYLGTSALRRGFHARIFAYDLRIFDPTWSRLRMGALASKLALRIPHLRDERSRKAADAYLDFLRLGGEIAFDELTPGLLRAILNRDHPVLAGLSATYLYRMARERHDERTHELVDDDVAGDATGHFLVIAGYDQWGRRFKVLDPSAHVPRAPDGKVTVEAQRLINAILLGDLTYDAVVLELWPNEGSGAGG